MKKHLLSFSILVFFLCFLSANTFSQEAPGSHQPDTPGIPFDVPEYPLQQFSVSNYPNPVIDYTTIRYIVPVKCIITLAIYGPSGRLITILFKGVKQEGSYSAKFNANGITQGTYICSLSYTSNNRHMTKLQKIHLVKN